MLKRVFVFLIIFSSITNLFGNAQAEIIEENSMNGLINLKISSPAIKQNIVSETSERNIIVYLPPGYNESEKRYPVIYYLHGFGEVNYEIMNHKDTFDRTLNN